jgi:antitoxin (DNA-binding transcriptional repressor) of toxin-antitoxin stability system
MARVSDITSDQLHEDTGAALRRAEGGEHLRVLVDRQPVAQLGPLEDVASWVEADVMEARVRGAQADAGLRRELDELQSQTIANL